MEQRIFRLIIGLAVVTMLVAGSISAASAYYAAGISSNKLYGFRAETPNGPIRGLVNDAPTVLHDFSGSALGGVAVSNGYAFVSDTTDVSGLLHVLRLTSVGANYIGKVQLKSGDTKVVEAGAVAVDANGGIYVLDKTASGTALYAYVNPNFDNIAGSTVNLGGLGGFNPQVGVAAYQGGGAVILTGGGPWNNSYAAAVNGGSGGTPTSVDTGDIDSSIPSAIAVNGNDGNAYIVTRPSDVAVKNGQLFAVDSALAKLGDGNGLNLPGVPHSVAVAGTGLDFLAIIGQGSAGGLQAWKVALNSGLPTGVSATATLNASDNSALHTAVSSSDGNMLWFTSPASQLPQSQQTVGTLDLTNWTAGSHPTMNFIGLADGVSAIAAYDYVPEPSSLISLLGFATCALTALRRRRR